MPVFCTALCRRERDEADRVVRELAVRVVQQQRQADQVGRTSLALNSCPSLVC